MIYTCPPPEDPLDQGDIIRRCPVSWVETFPADERAEAEASITFEDVYVLTQACDLASKKTQFVNVALVYEAEALVAAGKLKTADVKGPIRAGRVFGWYFLPGDAGSALSEMLVDLRQLHTLPVGPMTELCREGKRSARLLSPYREHLAKHFADTFSRIGLPAPYETE